MDPSRAPIVGGPARGRHQSAISPAIRVIQYQYGSALKTSAISSTPLELRSLFKEAEVLDFVLDSADLRNPSHLEPE